MKTRLPALVAVAAAVLGTAAPAAATFPGGNGRIAFVQDVDPSEATNFEIFTMEPDGSDVEQLTDDPGSDSGPAWSYDGTQIAFASRRAGPASDIYVMNADGSGVTRLTEDPVSATSPTFSPDGEWIAFVSHRDTPAGDLCRSCHPDVWKMRADGTGQTPLTTGATGGTPDWSPSGDRIAFTPSNGPAQWYVHTMRPDGTDLRQVTSIWGFGPRWSPEGLELVFTVDGGEFEGPEIYRVPADGGTAHEIPTAGRASVPLFSPNGGRIVYTDYKGDLIVAAPDGSDPVAIGDGLSSSWQRVPQPPYARPKSAGPYRAALVPAQRACSAPNREHGPPLAFPSCNPPEPVSNNVTVGTPDANAMPAKSIGHVVLRPRPGNPATPADEADVKVAASVSDVRCTESAIACTAGALTGYTGDLRVALPLRLTDAYVKDLPATSEGEVSVPMPCVAGGPDEGSACGIVTTVDAVVPGAIREGNRAIWELVRVEVWDGGQDGSLVTRDDDTLFATQGVFVP